jgi:hypothetical protein
MPSSDANAVRIMPAKAIEFGGMARLIQKFAPLDQSLSPLRAPKLPFCDGHRHIRGQPSPVGQGYRILIPSP